VGKRAEQKFFLLKGLRGKLSPLQAYQEREEKKARYFWVGKKSVIREQPNFRGGRR